MNRAIEYLMYYIGNKYDAMSKYRVGLWMKINIKMILIETINDCQSYLDDYACTGMMIGIILAFFYCLMLLYLSIRFQNISRYRFFKALAKAPFVALFGFYCYLILGITILSRETGTIYILRLIPFSTWGIDLLHIKLWVENIFMMIPFGILIYILWEPFHKIGWSILAGCSFSLLIECIQFFTKLGKFEIDDIINNVFGTLIGFLICKCIRVVSK